LDERRVALKCKRALWEEAVRMSVKDDTRDRNRTYTF